MNCFPPQGNQHQGIRTSIQGIGPSGPRFWSFLLGMLFVAISGSLVQAEDEWPQFRGPQTNGHADDANVPLTWSEKENVRWKTKIPGDGHSSPVISGNQIWLTTAIISPLTEAEQKQRLSSLKNSRGLEIAGKLSLRVLAIDRPTGQIIHDVELFQINDPPPVHSLNSYASPTPVIEKGKLYCHFGSMGTACVETQTARIVWKQNDLKVDHQNGPGASPASWKDRLIVNYDGIDQQFVVALSKDDGRVLWKTKRSGKLPEKREMQKAYCTPEIIDVNGRPQVISPGSNWVYGYDPSNGKELWRASYGSLGFSTVPRPVYANGLVYICTSYMQSKLLAVKLNGQGDVSASHIAWEFERQVPKKPSLLLVDTELYMVSDRGIGTCLDAKTGKTHWVERLTGEYSASPLYAAGRIYLFDQKGKTLVLEPGKKFHVLATNQLDAGMMASAAVVDDALYLRTETHLYRIEDMGKKSRD